MRILCARRGKSINGELYPNKRKASNPNLEIQGVVLSMFDGRANLSIQVVEEVKKYFKGSVYTTLIPRNVRLAEAPSHGKPVIIYEYSERVLIHT